VLGYEPGGFESLIAGTVADHLARMHAGPADKSAPRLAALMFRGG
jgi:hypothetical protein